MRHHDGCCCLENNSNLILTKLEILSLFCLNDGAKVRNTSIHSKFLGYSA